MTHRHTLLVVSVAVAMLVAPTIMAQETATATNTTNESEETAGMGAQLTAFTQSTSTAVNESVENGMWKAGFNQSNASDRARLVSDRAGTLEQRLERLQRQNESLRAAYEDGNVTESAYIARQSRLNARIDGLRTAINDTDEAATRAGVNDSRLDRLRENASNLTGPEVAAIARGLGGGPPANRGPPEDRGQPENVAERGQSADRSGGAGERDPPANRTQGGDSAADADTNTTGGADNETGSTGNAGGGSDSAGNDNGSSGDRGNDAGGQRGDDAPGRTGN